MPLEGLGSRIEVWPGKRILADVYIGEILHPDWTYNQLKARHTRRTMIERGTWDYPLLVMAAPEGFEDWAGPHPDFSFCLIEGHLRYRFLNALIARGEGTGDHEVLVLENRA